MNRLILMGNGFDLAHGLKTDYNSFILWYLKSCFKKAAKEEYSDQLITVKQIANLYTLPIDSTQNIYGFVDHFYKTGFLQLKNKFLPHRGVTSAYVNPYILKFNSAFFERIIKNSNEEKWVNIENEFYDELKNSLTNSGANVAAIKELNSSLKFITSLLDQYLSILDCKKFSTNYSDLLASEIKTTDIFLTPNDLHETQLYKNMPPGETLILNFNYTSTVENYLKQRDDLPFLKIPISVNYIHGEVDSEINPIIFGFGDELDVNYKKIEDSGANEFFEYIKSFWYFKTSNYHRLLRFIENDTYQIYILGHSCGLSDRTLLNMLFEHKHCKSIKIYHYDDGNKNNYTTLTQEISRHFHDKVSMRAKIVSFNNSSAMPQVV